ncbi:IucA/IucC family protein [Brevibacillus brevis]|uniref:IucA/IucC family protein n=1 Tax=Brevibacillus brevis TaxID=1393 RepID=A0ABY9TBS9_BREBE|nr:IucA/IucC family protein [Brevibacillus brevis]WNC17516.1 IucA/IucC family protein [Brevibacillus brevis]
MAGQQTDTTVSLRSAELAEQATVRAVLNSYVRETGAANLHADGAFLLALRSVGKTIRGTLTYVSLIGQHGYGPHFYEVGPDGRDRLLGTAELIELLLEELSVRAEGGLRKALVNQMKERIENSRRKMGIYVDHVMSQHRQAGDTFDCIRSEQSLYFGHPFHPYPKSTEGFAEGDLAAYCPELGAAFPLHYFAVHREWVSEEWLDGHGPVLPPVVIDSAEQHLGVEASEYAIVPMHPWQADYVSQLPEFQSLQHRGYIVSLGQLGPFLYPTSSVRTVWDPEGGYGYKLPLHVRITNLLRENTEEQVRRTMDGAKVIHHLKAELETDSFQILSETGYVSVRLGASESSTFSPALTVLHRPMAVDTTSTYVMASLLECFPGEAEPKLIQAMRQSTSGRVPDLKIWLGRYLEISLLPQLRLFAQFGIGFEAHLQNSLLSLKNGLPHCYYVRDLEGVSIVRHLAEEAGWIDTLVSRDSAVLYDESEVWRRIQYYLLVNHLGSLLHVIAAYLGEGEERCWQVVRELLLREQAGASGRLFSCIDDLLHAETLPAKANFLSCFLDRGERPLFIGIRNPLKA